MRTDLLQGLLIFPVPQSEKKLKPRRKFFQIIPAQLAQPTRLSRRIAMTPNQRNDIWKKLRERKNI
jgi:hypothetical protein